MAKRILTLKIRLPAYRSPRNAWRKAIYRLAVRAPVQYRQSDRLEVIVRLYLNSQALLFHDVDNRLKDIFDALQGRMGGPKKIRRFPPIIPNDSQIFRATIEKFNPPGQSHGLGHLTVRKLHTQRVTPADRKQRGG